MSHATVSDSQTAVGKTTPWLLRMSIFAAVGMLQLLINFPKFLTTLIDANVAEGWGRMALKAPVLAVKMVMQVLIGNDPGPFFERAMTCAFLLFWVFFALLAIFAIRRRGYQMLACAIAGMIAGYVAAHLLSWVAVAIAVAIGGVIFVCVWVGALIAAIFHFLIQGPVLTAILVLGGLGVGWVARHEIERFVLTLVNAIRNHIVRMLAGTFVLGLAVLVSPYVFRWLILPVFRFLKMVLTPVLHVLWLLLTWGLLVIAVIIGVVLIVVVGMIALALLGSLFVSQVQAAWHAAQSRRLMLIAGFAIGSSLALLVLVSLATPSVAADLNQALLNPFALLAPIHHQTTIITDLFEATLPGSVRAFVFTYLTNLQAPTFDCFVFLTIMVLASSSVFFRVFSTKPVDAEEVSVTFVAKEYGLMAGGLLVALVLIFLQAGSGDSSA